MMLQSSPSCALGWGLKSPDPGWMEWTTALCAVSTHAASQHFCWLHCWQRAALAKEIRPQPNLAALSSVNSEVHVAHTACSHGWFCFHINQTTSIEEYSGRGAQRGTTARAGQSMTENTAIHPSWHLVPYRWCPKLHADPGLPKNLSAAQMAA